MSWGSVVRNCRIIMNVEKIYECLEQIFSLLTVSIFYIAKINSFYDSSFVFSQ